LSRFRALSWPDRRVLVLAALLLPLVWAAVRVLGFARVHARLGTAGAPDAPSPVADPVRIGYLVNAAAGLPLVPATCLTRSLLLNWLLRRRGVRSELRIGVRMEGSALDAHAWVECEGRPVNDAPDVGRRFAAFDGPLHPRSFSSP
jgi:hypothetical protein